MAAVWLMRVRRKGVWWVLVATEGVEGGGRF